jgi:hypothetical protein
VVDPGDDAGFDSAILELPDGASAVIDSGRTPSDAGGPPDPCAAVRAPGCTPLPGCGAIYFAPGTAIDPGTFNFETVYESCSTHPGEVEELINGKWSGIASVANQVFNGTDKTSTYLIGTQFPIAIQPVGSEEGTSQQLRACTVQDTCVVCDPPTTITVPSCGTCQPTSCGPGKFLDSQCQCGAAICPCPHDPYPACTTPAWLCFAGGD